MRGKLPQLASVRGSSDDGQRLSQEKRAYHSAWPRHDIIVAKVGKRFWDERNIISHCSVKAIRLLDQRVYRRGQRHGAIRRGLHARS